MPAIPEPTDAQIEGFLNFLPAPGEIGNDWASLVIQTVGPVWNREGLTPGERSIATIAALTARHLPNELRLHINRGLDNGLSREKVCEVIMHMAIYGGFPTAVEGMRIAKEVFAERDAAG